MRLNQVLGQRLAGVMGALYADSFANHEDCARQLEGIASTARGFHAQELAKQPLTQPLPTEPETSLEG